MDMAISFPGGKVVNATYRKDGGEAITVRTDQSKDKGGEGSGPEPFDLFLVSIGTCAGMSVLSFCQQRDIPSEGIQLSLHAEREGRSGLVARIALDIELPTGFPDKYVDAVWRGRPGCAPSKRTSWSHRPSRCIRI